ncbi:hypothetical protein DFQ14_102102 [Halopolyspora algeriensis]|uniref:DUF3311 domain-containing protein n=1 Tax=Halopolyspora algeriensis TaxID=1500506 RepID=A0A368VZN4_9ACTN|nr:hypothetical protein [Halopolyspora algeriensis]RCW45801.1 hypothetical protein DFQ14_102102 [Halopolyspora algeriensis]TQM54185.1 hypothetical protein FHU43_2364 [Halopolyspora algeriensis]
MPAPDNPSRSREPIRIPWIWAGLVALLVAGIPWYLPEGTIGPTVLGMPLWTWVTIGSSVALCAYLSWVLTRHWHLVEDIEEAEAAAPTSDTGADGTEGRH